MSKTSCGGTGIGTPDISKQIHYKYSILERRLCLSFYECGNNVQYLKTLLTIMKVSSSGHLGINN